MKRTKQQQQQKKREIKNKIDNNIQTKIKSEINNDLYMKDFASNISTAMNGDGLEISIFDNNEHPMFKQGSTELTDDGKLIVERITQSILYTPNHIVISGYTEKVDNNSITGNSGWGLSAGRADATRKIMQITGLPEERIAKLVSYGDNKPLDNDDPYSPKNRRITITLMTQWSTVQYKVPISNSALSLEK